MEISEIKARLSILTVLQHYGLKADTNNRLCCPFHKDKTPSMQVYPETNTFCCFSSNCDAGTGDTIQFIELYDKQGKHQAISKAGTIISPQKTEPEAMSKSAVLTKAFQIFGNALRASDKAKPYLQSRNLPQTLEVGYNSGGFLQYSKPLTASFEKYSLISQNKFGTGYHVFAKNSIVFPLKSADNHIVGLYFRSIEENPKSKHYYLKNRAGLYPAYPKADTKTLILTESVIDAASLANYLLPFENYCVLALYGTNGFTEEHETAIRELKSLESILLFFDGDEAGRKAGKSLKFKIETTFPKVQVSIIQTPHNEDINSLSVAYDIDFFNHLFSQVPQEPKPEPLPEPETTPEEPITNKLSIISPELLIYDNCELKISVLGGIRLSGLDRMRVTLKVEHKEKQFLPVRHNLDLYHSLQTEQLIGKVAETLEVSPIQTSQTVELLTQSLENYRSERLVALEPKKKERKTMTDKEKQQALDYLKKPDLLDNTSGDIARSGLIGEEVNRMIAFLIYTSRKREQPLHLLCLGASGSGKTYLQEKVSQLVPEEDKIEITTLSENAFYYFGQEELKHKLLLIEDLDGAESVMYPLRELQSKRKISKTVTLKDTKGNLRTVTLLVEGPVCVSGCTTKERIYEDNANRCILIDIDTSQEQDEKIISYQRAMSAGTINKSLESQTVTLLQNCQRLLKPISVRNPYAPLIALPETVFKPRRTIGLLLSFIETITFYHQYGLPLKQDKATGESYIETTPTHIKQAFALLSEVLFRKSDELSFACRSFFEKLKNYLQSEKKESFYSKEIRSAFRMPPTTLNRHLFELERFGLLRAKGNRFKGFEYTFSDKNDAQTLKELIDKHLQTILTKIG
jgi:DNA primase